VDLASFLLLIGLALAAREEKGDRGGGERERVSLESLFELNGSLMMRGDVDGR
jgi:hypothetical protein